MGPNFLIVGAAKSGTTSLTHYLRQHPDIFVSNHKECHYFASSEILGRSNGPGDDIGVRSLVISSRERFLRTFERGAARPAVGEASVHYINERKSLERALDFNPAMKFIVMLRNPQSRAMSAFCHHRRDGRETLSNFDEALSAEPVRADAGWSHGWLYANGSNYGAQLAAAQAIVPPEQLLVVILEEFKTQPDQHMRRIFTFIGVRSDIRINTSLVFNKSGTPKSQTINDLLVYNSTLKRAARHIVPYRVGSAVLHWLRSVNLREAGPAPAELPVFRSYRLETERRLGRRIAAWSGGPV